METAAAVRAVVVMTLLGRRLSGGQERTGVGGSRGLEQVPGDFPFPVGVEEQCPLLTLVRATKLFEVCTREVR